MPLLVRKIFYAGAQIRLIWPVITVVLIITLGELLVVDPFGALLGFFGLSEPRVSNAQEWSPAVYESLKRSLRSLVVVIAVWTSTGLLMKKPFSFTGFTLNEGWPFQLLVGVLLGFVVQVSALVLMASFGWYRIEGLLWHFMSISALFPALLYACVFSAETGIVEESIFRGFLMNSLADRFNLRIGVVISSMIFGLLHFSGFAGEFPWWMSLTSATIGGFLFAQAYLLFNNIWAPLGLHFAWHFSARILGTPGVNPEEACLLITKVEGPVLFVVTKAGGASLLELVGIGLSSLSILLIRKRVNT